MTSNQNKAIVLLTDFGISDPFIGVMKGIIYTINPNALIIDLAHGISAQNILQACFTLTCNCSYFPIHSIFCVVVDPGVGSNRKPICIQTKDYTFVGPDNGVLWGAVKNREIVQIIHLTNDEYFIKPISNTFHGRDIFSPVSAHLSKGVMDISDFGSKLDNCVHLDIPEPEKNNNQWKLTILDEDRFGNLTLNITHTFFDNVIENQSFELEIGGHIVKTVTENYSQSPTDVPVLIKSSSGYMEIALKNQKASKILGLQMMETAYLKIV